MSTIILTNNINNINLVDYLINNIKRYGFSEENIVSLTINLETIDGTQRATSTLIYNNNGNTETITKTLNINYETAIKTDTEFNNHILYLLGLYPNSIYPITINYNGVPYICDKVIAINRIPFFALTPPSV